MAVIKLAALVTAMVFGAGAATAPPVSPPVVKMVRSASSPAAPAPVRGGESQLVTVEVPGDVFEVSPSVITTGGATRVLVADLRDAPAGWRLVASAPGHNVRIGVTDVDPIVGSRTGIRTTRRQTLAPGEEALLATAGPGRGAGTYWIALHVDLAGAARGTPPVVLRVEDAASGSLGSNL